MPVEVPLTVTARDLAMLGTSKLLRGTVRFTTHDPGTYERGITELDVDGSYTLTLVEFSEGSVIATSAGTLNGKGSTASFDAAIREAIDANRAAVVQPLVSALSASH